MNRSVLYGMIPTYTALVREGRKTLAQVPEAIRGEVKAAVEEEA